MNPNRFLVSFIFRSVLLMLLVGAGFIALLPSSNGTVLASSMQPNGFQQASGFLGAWCAQGDPGKRASISASGGGFLRLTNENGDTSVGNVRGPNQVTAPQWQFVAGTLSGNGSRISWSNGTFWARCYDGSGGGYYRLNLTGTWYANGDRSKSCSIQQHRQSLNLQNESGQGASGSFTGRDRITTNWAGATIGGSVTRDGNRINWDNGTYWVRYRLYTQ